METENKIRKEPVYSMKLKAGRKRTYFFDIRPTKSDDFYLTITESKKKFNEDRYERHKIFLYKEDFNKFLDVLNTSIDYCKNELMPEYNFDEFHREDDITNLTNETLDTTYTPETTVANTEVMTETVAETSSVLEDEESLKW